MENIYKEGLIAYKTGYMIIYSTGKGDNKDGTN